MNMIDRLIRYKLFICLQSSQPVLRCRPAGGCGTTGLRDGGRLRLPAADVGLGLLAAPPARTALQVSRVFRCGVSPSVYRGGVKKATENTIFDTVFGCLRKGFSVPKNCGV